MIDRRHAVQHQQCDPVDRHADDLPWTAIETGHHQQPDRPDKRRNRPEQMAPGVESFPVVHVPLTSKSQRRRARLKADNTESALFPKYAA
ncbi:hypothetical protein D3C75_1304650 [compost metagenome]